MMGCWSRFHQFFVIVLVVFITLFTGGISTNTTSISDAIFPIDALHGRSLLQVKTSCPVNFEFQDYKIITNQCKGPKYPPDLCCPAFTKFACPFAEKLNNLANDCFSKMLTYMNLHGIPNGLFASICRDGKDGLACPAQPPSESDNVSSSFTTSNPPPLLHILTAAFLFVLLRLL